MNQVNNTKPQSNKLVAGIGINDADYDVSKDGRITCQYYKEWSQLLYRLDKFGSTVCDEWRRFSTFKTWMKQQDWEGKSLDKDLLGRKQRHYSPENCVFISHKLNTLIASTMHQRMFKGEPTKYLRGVCRRGGGWQYLIGDKQNILKPWTAHKITFPTEIAAHRAWCRARAHYIREHVHQFGDDHQLKLHILSFAQDLHDCKFTTREEFEGALNRQAEIEKQEIIKAEAEAYAIQNKADRKRRALVTYAIETEIDGVMNWFPSKTAHHHATKKLHQQYTIKTDKGEITDTLPKLCVAIGVNQGTVEKRIRKQGMSVEEALTKPLKHTRSNSKPAGYWTKEKCHNEALKYPTKSDWRREDRSSYESAKYHGWYDACSVHMEAPFKWTEELLLESASQYSSLAEWKRNKSAAPAKARDFGILEDCKLAMK